MSAPTSAPAMAPDLMLAAGRQTLAMRAMDARDESLRCRTTIPVSERTASRPSIVFCPMVRMRIRDPTAIADNTARTESTRAVSAVADCALTGWVKQNAAVNATMRTTAMTGSGSSRWLMTHGIDAIEHRIREQSWR
jgi:hypothetical protein